MPRIKPLIANREDDRYTLGQEKSCQTTFWMINWKSHVTISIMFFQLPLTPWWWRWLILLAQFGAVQCVATRQQGRLTSKSMLRQSIWVLVLIVSTVTSFVRAKTPSIPTCQDTTFPAKINLEINLVNLKPFRSYCWNDVSRKRHKWIIYMEMYRVWPGIQEER